MRAKLLHGLEDYVRPGPLEVWNNFGRPRNFRNVKPTKKVVDKMISERLFLGPATLTENTMRLAMNWPRALCAIRLEEHRRVAEKKRSCSSVPGHCCSSVSRFPKRVPSFKFCD